MALSVITASRVKTKLRQWSAVWGSSGLTGARAASLIFRNAGIRDVEGGAPRGPAHGIAS